MSREILITGGTGFVGTELVPRLAARDKVWVTSRNASRARTGFEKRGCHVDALDWDPTSDLPELGEIGDCAAVVHLAGEPVADRRWNPEVRRRIRESRVQGTRNLVEAIGQLPEERRPRTLIAASAVGYYGNRGEEELTEDAGPGEGFLAEVCVDWEAEAWRARELGVRVVCVRVGIVLDGSGGALGQMLTPFRWGVGGRLGSGKQWMPWISRTDLVRMIEWCLDSEEVKGPVNGVGPAPSRNADFTRELGRAVRRPTIFPVPGFALSVVVGEFGEYLLHSQRVIPDRAARGGFTFEHPDLGSALQASLTR